MKWIVILSLTFFLYKAESQQNSVAFDQHTIKFNKEKALNSCNNFAKTLLDITLQKQMKKMCQCVANTTDYEQVNTLYQLGSIQELQNYMFYIGQRCLGNYNTYR